jgi:hypothetical protein
MNKNKQYIFVDLYTGKTELLTEYSFKVWKVDCEVVENDENKITTYVSEEYMILVV